MPDLTFRVSGAKMVPYAASPIVALDLTIINASPSEQVHSIMLQCQVRIDAPARSYEMAEKKALREVFGAPDLWGRSLKSLLWTQATLLVTAFAGATTAELHLPCTRDFDLAIAKYFHALDDASEIPMSLLFSGTVFHASQEDGALSVAQIPWTKEASYRMPVRVYKDAIDHYYPNSQSITLQRDLFDRLYQHKMKTGATTWDQVVESLLPVDEVERIA
jgi:hypothetical protein